MYNDRNRQNFHSARQVSTAARVGGDLPRLDADQGGRRCDGSSPDSAMHDQVSDRDRNGAVRSWGLHDHPLAMVYSPYQHFRDIYTPELALDRGTLFSELDLPFEGAGNKRNGGCIR